MRIISGTAKGTKLYTLEGTTTRPTLDRVKESIFNIIQNELEDVTFLDLFSGSGAIGLEALSRGAKRAILCDESKDAIKIIKLNAEKTHLTNKTEILNCDFKICLNKINEKVDIIFLDPPYKTNYIYEALEIIQKKEIANEETLIILETEDKERIKNQIQNLQFEIIDERKYGIANILFLKRKNLNLEGSKV
ncbi:MAG: 16S rRNA (guanine(966)-N(2))-methyltransferase RsmD [Clostridia bacterium]|nr:16S rRNA (guanine(966)-N(2))-methyltransferase RsmD [Clostridia bacterium]